MCLTRLIVPSGQSFDAATYVTNSITAAGGVDIQDVSEAKVYGPKLITRNQPRAVTPDDYVRIVCEHPLVDKAVAKFVWTGCWFTVLVAVALRNEQSLSDKLANEIRELVEGKKLIGYAVEIREPIYANIVLAISVSVNPKFHGGDVYNAVVSKLSSKTSSSGQKGFFAS